MNIFILKLVIIGAILFGIKEYLEEYWKLDELIAQYI